MNMPAWPWVDPYVADLSVPGMVYAVLVRASAPSARLRSVDLRPALLVPGVLAAVDGGSFPRPGGLIHSSRDEPVLAIDRVRYAGEPVAAVAAITEEIAVEAAARVAVEAEALPAIPSMEAAHAAPALHHEHPGNVLRDIHLCFGPVDEAFAEARTVYSGSFHYGASTHAALEPHGVLAWWRPEKRLWVWTSTQCPHLVQHELARLLSVDPSAVRVMTPRVGGGFGGKSELYCHEVVAAKLSMMLQRPVRIVLSREEVFYTHRGRHEARIDLRLALGPRHEILAIDADILLNGGAYSGLGLVTSYYAGQLLAVPYRLGSLRFRSRRIFTTAPPSGPKRGHGSVQVRCAMERLMDKAAVELGLDPLAWRASVALGPDETTVNGLRIGSTGFAGCLARIAEQTRTVSCDADEGVGVAGSAYVSGAAFPIMPNRLPHSQAMVRADRSGLFAVTVGVAEIGQGACETLRALVAETLQQDPSCVVVATGDTDSCPVDVGSYSSRVTVMAGNAALAAATTVRRVLLETAAARLQMSASDLTLAPGRVVARDDPNRGLALDKVIAAAEERHGIVVGGAGFTPHVAKGPYPGGAVGPTPAFSFTAAAARVRVDRDLGSVKVRDIWIAHDCGRAVDLRRVTAQIHGCAVMAVGEALTEHCTLKKGVIDPVGLLDYGVPTALDIPSLHATVVASPDPSGPTGAKEAGEGPLLAVVPALVNAAARASGIDLRSVPVDPEDLVWAAAPPPRAEG